MGRRISPASVAALASARQASAAQRSAAREAGLAYARAWRARFMPAFDSMEAGGSFAADRGNSGGGR